MKYALTTLAMIVAANSSADAWSSGMWGPSYGGLLVRPSSSSGMCTPSQIMKQRQDMLNGVFTQSSPRYEIKDSDEKFEIAVDVPGMSVSDIHISIEDSNVLSISGQRETDTFKTKFSKSFSLDPAVDLDHFTATLQNGVLAVSAPKDLKRIEQNIRQIPIMQLSADDATTAAVPSKGNDQVEIPVDKNEETTSGGMENDGHDDDDDDDSGEVVNI